MPAVSKVTKTQATSAKAKDARPPTESKQQQQPKKSFLLNWKNKYAALAALVAAVTVTEVEPRKWYHQEFAAFSQTKEELFNYVTYLNDIPEWFPLVYHIKEVDKKPLMIGKEYRAECNCLFSRCSLPLKVTSLTRGTRLVFEVDSWLRPVISAEVGWTSNGRTRLTIGVFFNRKSLAFQYTVAPFLKFLSMQHIKYALFQLSWLLPFDSSQKPPLNTAPRQ